MDAGIGCGRRPNVPTRVPSVPQKGVTESTVPRAPAARTAPAALETAMKGAGIVWLSPSGADASAHPYTTGPIWHVWSDGACYVLTGPGEQAVPGVVDGSRCEVTARNLAGGRAITWTATVAALDPAGADWAAVAPKLAANRLNGGDPVAVLPTWPGRLTILRLQPTGEIPAAGTSPSDDSQAAAPLPSPATTPYRMPADLTRAWRRRRAARKRKA